MDQYTQTTTVEAVQWKGAQNAVELDDFHAWGISLRAADTYLEDEAVIVFIDRPGIEDREVRCEKNHWIVKDGERFRIVKPPVFNAQYAAV